MKQKYKIIIITTKNKRQRLGSQNQDHLSAYPQLDKVEKLLRAGKFKTFINNSELESLLLNQETDSLKSVLGLILQ